MSSEVQSLADLARTPGWKIYEDKVRQVLDSQANQLKTCKPEGLLFLQGKIHGLEQAIRLVTVPVELHRKMNAG